MKTLSRKVVSFIDPTTQEELHTVSSEILANILRKDRPCDEINILGEIEHHLKPLSVFRNETDYGNISEETKKVIYTAAQKYWTEISNLHKPEKIQELAAEVIKKTSLDDVDFENDITSVLKDHVNGVYTLAKDTLYFRNLITDIKKCIISQVHPTYIIYPKKTILEDVNKLFSNIESYKGPNKAVAAITTFLTGISFIQISSITNTLASSGITLESLLAIAKQDPIGFVGMLAIPVFFIIKTITTINTLKQLFSQGKQLTQQYVHPKNFEVFLESVNRQTGNTRTKVKHYIKYALYQELQNILRIQKDMEKILSRTNSLRIDETKEEALFILEIKKFLHLWLKRLPKDHILHSTFNKILKDIHLGNIQEQFDILSRIVLHEKGHVFERMSSFEEHLEYPEDNNLKVHYSLVNLLLGLLRFTLKTSPKTAKSV